MSNPTHRGPRPLSAVLGDLFTVRGYNRLFARQELENAWQKAVGEPHCHQTRLGEVRRGVLNVTVAHSTLLEELSSFRKLSLLKVLHSDAPATVIHDIRFRVGAVVEPGSEAEPRSALAVEEIRRSQASGRSEHAGRGNKGKPRRTSGPDPVES